MTRPSLDKERQTGEWFLKYKLVSMWLISRNTHAHALDSTAVARGHKIPFSTLTRHNYLSLSFCLFSLFTLSIIHGISSIKENNNNNKKRDTIELLQLWFFHEKESLVSSKKREGKLQKKNIINSNANSR